MKVYNLTTEKCASRSVGGAIEVILGDKYLKTYPEKHSKIFPKFIQSYYHLTTDDWNNFDKLCDDNYVFQFVRNPFDRFVSSFIMAYGGDEGHNFIADDIPKLRNPISKENQLLCFKDFCKRVSDSFNGGNFNMNSHVMLQTDCLSFTARTPKHNIMEFDICDYIERKKYNIFKVENYDESLETLTSDFEKNNFVTFKFLKNIGKIGDRSSKKFSTDYRDWYNDETYNLMSPHFKKEMELFNYEF